MLRYGNTSDPNFGDVHYYNYKSTKIAYHVTNSLNFSLLSTGNCLDESVLPLSRMTSEFGWWSFPSLPTWLSALNVSDLFLDNPAVANRIHHPHAIEEVVDQTKYHFTPIVFLNNHESFAKFIHISQVRTIVEF